MFKTNNCVVIAFDNEKETYSNIVKFWIDTDRLLTSQIICQDAIIRFKSKPGILKQLLERLRK